jgi:hypothetical protein
MYALPYSPQFYGIAPPSPSAPNTAWKDGSSFSFHDVLDTLNPLQHLPLVGTLYRWITGDEPGDVARVVGDGLYGGPIGFVTGAISAAVKDDTGKDPGEMAMALLTGEDSTPARVASTAATGAAGTAAEATATAATGDAAAPAVTTGTATAATTAPFGSHGTFMPLYRSAPPVAQPGNGAAAQAMPTQRATGARPSTHMVPLQLTGPQLPQSFARTPIATPARTAPSAAPAAAPSGGGAAAQPAAAPAASAPATLPDLSALPQNATVDIPQRMMDALDKYARMQQAQQRGQAVDVAP